MPFKRYVEIGRVAMINYGEEFGKLVIISDVIDQNRALVDHPDQERRMINFKRLALTDQKLDVPRLVKKTALKKAFTEGEVEKKFNETAWGQKLAKRKAKATMGDFDRFKLQQQRMKKSAAVNKALAKMKA